MATTFRRLAAVTALAAGLTAAGMVTAGTASADEFDVHVSEDLMIGLRIPARLTYRLSADVVAR